VFPDFKVSAALPANHRTTVRLDPAEAVEFGFACGARGGGACRGYCGASDACEATAQMRRKRTFPQEE